MTGQARLFLLLLSIGLSSSAPALADTTTGHLRVDGREREYLVHLPPGFSTKESLPVVLVFHGGGGEDESTEAMSGMDEVADRHHFIAVYPQGTRNTWNGGICCGYASKHNVDDVGFVTALIKELHSQYNIDLRRVYATGISNGAQMSYRLSCELSESIAAIAPIGGQLELKEACQPRRRVPVLHIHGTADPCSPYNGGEQCGGCWGKLVPILGDLLAGNHWPCPPVEQLLEQTAVRNGCAASTRTTYTKGAVTCYAFDHCPAGDDVNLCKIEGGGHTWPGHQIVKCMKSPNSWACRKYTEGVGPTNYDIDASEFMWGFFEAHHL